MWDNIWKNTPSREYWRDSLGGGLISDYKRFFLKYLPSGVRVLEAGYGIGHVVLALRALGFRCIGLDYALNTVRILNKVFPDVPFHFGDIRDLPYTAGSFDGYISLGVIEPFAEGQERMLD